MKLLKFIIVVLSTTFTGMVFAQEAKLCDLETFALVLDEVDNAPDEKKELAIAELKMAKEKLIAEDKEACSTHLTNASNVAAAD